MMNVWIGLAGSMAIAGLAYWKQSLSGSGAAAAVVVGWLLYVTGSPAWYGTLIAFFLSSSFLSHYKKKLKKEAESGYAKSGKRDAGQVLANGGLAAACGLLHYLFPHPVWWMAFVGAMAAVNADTWATEIGGISRAQPRSIVTWKKVAAGTSGGVTWAGIAASAAGGLFIGMMSWLFLSLWPAQVGSSVLADGPSGLLSLSLLGLAGGISGSLADSFAGAKWQEMHRCRKCGKEIERTVHCGIPALRIRGLRGMNNEAVNLLASAVGAAAAVTAGMWLV
ncbi:DUF92 domain-containing protein [Ferviditalea candida]|uniref:DUF92 domain-containing protein n=1 Tax=Ferviditalea candida TaxID=3108399 RepID=A0ABU5ZCN4_9BACL|nr:DUF92 domain-containing protein [Paenibacillaceae bacterium T2]